MLIKLRENIFLADQSVTAEEIEKAGITAIVAVAQKAYLEYNASLRNKHIAIFGLINDGMNPTHIKDLACHSVKYFAQFGEKVLVFGDPTVRGAYVAARAVCEIEERGLHEILLELKEEMQSLDIGRAYL